MTVKRILSAALLFAVLLWGCATQNRHVPADVLTLARETAEKQSSRLYGEGYLLQSIDGDRIATAGSVEELVDPAEPPRWLFVLEGKRTVNAFTVCREEERLSCRYTTVSAAYITAMEQARRLSKKGVPTLLRYQENDYFLLDNGYVLAAFTPSTQEDEKAAGRVAYYDSVVDFVAALQAVSAANAALPEGSRGGEVAYPTGHYLPE